MINKERLLKEFLELVAISCSSGNERQVADLVKTRLTALGLSVTEDNAGQSFGGNAGNVVASWPGNVPGAPAIMLSAHLDCVEPCKGIKPKLVDGVITAAGDTILGGDDKIGVAGILEALRTAWEQRLPHGDVQIVFTVAEETGLNGAKAIDRSLLRADYGFILDGGPVGEVNSAAPGQNFIKAIIRGKAAHAGAEPEAGVNAIVTAAQAIAAMKLGRIDAETTANTGVIKGGTATNIIPDYVEISLEARSRDNAKLEAQTRHMTDAIEKAAAQNGAKAEISVRKAYDPYTHMADSPVIGLVRQASDSIGLPLNLKPTGGGSDANYFNLFGIPSAVLGTGASKAHTLEESVREIDLYTASELMLALIQTAAKAK